MNSWTDIEARRETIRAFVEHLHKPENKAERDKCTTDRAYAKELFARLGDFELQKGFRARHNNENSQEDGISRL